MVQIGTSSYSIADMIDSGEIWIIDLSATDHNTYFFPHFLNSTGGKFFVVTGTRSIQISPDILPENVLHVPSLSHNLLSVCKLTADLNCHAHFSKSTFVFFRT